ncbi:MAG: hypothetical protein ACR2FU_20325, partial [Streptosporangiaceae bacterium]
SKDEEDKTPEPALAKVGSRKASLAKAGARVWAKSAGDQDEDADAGPRKGAARRGAAKDDADDGKPGSAKAASAKSGSAKSGAAKARPARKAS